jgi:hypothetical protein
MTEIQQANARFAALILKAEKFRMASRRAEAQSERLKSMRDTFWPDATPGQGWHISTMDGLKLPGRCHSY